MTNEDYVRKNAFVPNTQHGHLFTDNNGTMYSYGYHYPLLFKVNGLTFVNVAGYSHTTAIHINHARPLATYEIRLNEYRANDISVETIIQTLKNEMDHLEESISNIKRKDTQKGAMLQKRVNDIGNTLAQLNY